MIISDFLLSVIKTYFVKSRIGPSAERETPRAPRSGQKQAESGNPASPDAIKINIEDTDKEKAKDVRSNNEIFYLQLEGCLDILFTIEDVKC